MNTDELWALCKWTDTEVVERKVASLYSALATAVQRNTQPNQARQSFEAQKVALLAALNDIHISDLTQEQQDLLDNLSLKPHLGVAGAKEIEDILFRNALDIATAAERLQENSSTITRAIEKIQQIQAGLDGLIDVEQVKTEPEEALLRVKFTGSARIANVVDLQKWSDDWLTIGRGIAMAHGRPPEEVRVVGATKGSIIVELAVSLAVAKTASAIILEALNLTSRVLNILKEFEAVRTLRLGNKKIAIELKKEAEKERAAGAAAISTSIVQKTKLDQKSEGDKITALESAIKVLVKFMSKGGEVDCYLPKDLSEDIKDSEVKNEITKAFTEIRELEDQQRLIKHELDSEDDVAPDSEQEESDD